jgi:L-iditol 2-dehydrogenase
MRDSLPRTMKAIVLTEPGKFECQEVLRPTPEAGEVLCRIRCVAICGSDPAIIRGDFAAYRDPAFPFIPGHEWSGEVVAVGEGVSDFKPGDRVAGEAHKGCGYCTYCLEGRYNLCENYGQPRKGHRHYGFINYGAYAEYNTYSRKAVNKLPDNVSFREGALVDPAGVAVHTLSLTRVTPGGTVVVLGPGPIGLITMRMARLTGAAKIIAIGRQPRLEAAERLCAATVVDFEKEDPVDAVSVLTASKGADEVFECSGAEGTLNQAVRMLRKGGRVGVMGNPKKNAAVVPLADIINREISIFGSRANPNVSKNIIALISAGHLVVKDLISHAYPLEAFAAAVDTFVTRREGALKVVIESNSENQERETL